MKLRNMDDRMKLRFKYSVLLVLITCFIFACFMNFGSVWKFLCLLMGIIKPLIIGSLIAVVLNVPMKGFHDLITWIPKKFGKKIPEKAAGIISLILTLLSTFLVVIVVISVVVPQLIDSLASIGEMMLKCYPTLLRTLREYGVDTSSIEEFMDMINYKEIISRVTENASTIVTTAFSAASSVIGVLFNGFTGFIIAIYLLAGKKNFSRQSRKLLYAYVDKKKADTVCSIGSLVNSTFSSFISGQCLEAVILGCMFFITMMIFRYPYALTISIFIGMMNLIPYIGATFGLVIGFLLIIMVDPVKAFLFIIMFLVLQQIEGNLIYPKVVGGSVGLPAVLTLLAVLVGGSLFGIVGMLFFIPLTSVFYSLLRNNMNRRLDEKNITIK